MSAARRNAMTRGQFARHPVVPVGKEGLNHANADPDFDLIRDHPRFQAMIAAAEARLGES